MKSLYVKTINLGLPHGLLCFFQINLVLTYLPRSVSLFYKTSLWFSSAPHIQNLVVKYHEKNNNYKNLSLYTVSNVYKSRKNSVTHPQSTLTHLNTMINPWPILFHVSVPSDPQPLPVHSFAVNSRHIISVYIF